MKFIYDFINIYTFNCFVIAFINRVMRIIFRTKSKQTITFLID